MIRKILLSLSLTCALHASPDFEDEAALTLVSVDYSNAPLVIPQSELLIVQRIPSLEEAERTAESLALYYPHTQIEQVGSTCTLVASEVRLPKIRRTPQLGEETNIFLDVVVHKYRRPLVHLFISDQVDGSLVELIQDAKGAQKVASLFLVCTPDRMDANLAHATKDPNLYLWPSVDLCESVIERITRSYPVEIPVSVALPYAIDSWVRIQQASLQRKSALKPS